MSIPQIHDKEGRCWNININPWTVRQVREALDVNLLEILQKDSTLAAELEDPVKSVRLIWCLCQQQAAERNVSEQAFWEALDQDMLDAAALAIMEGLASFSRAAIRPALAKVAEKTAKLRETIGRQIAAAVASGELDRLLDAQMDRLAPPLATDQTEEREQGRNGAGETSALPASGPTTCSTGASSSSASSETSTACT